MNTKRHSIGRPWGRATARLLAILAAVAVVAALLPPAPPPAAADRSFSPEAFFADASVSAGHVTTMMVRRNAFTAEFSGTVTGDRLQLDERFHFADGDPLQRWDLTRVSPTRYEGTVRTETGDGVLRPPVPVDGWLIPGGAILDYRGYAPGGGDTLFHFQHRMVAQADGTVRNRVSILKFGFLIARADVTFAKSEAALPGR